MHTELKLTMKSRNTTSPDKGPSYTHLIAFAGHWKITGTKGPKNSSYQADTVSGEEVFEWLDGDYFLINRFDRKTAGSRFTGIGWIGYDKVSSGYLFYSISNLGYFRIYEVEVNETKIKINGETERGVLELNNEENILSIYWEQSKDGQNWDLLYDLTGHRIT